MTILLLAALTAQDPWELAEDRGLNPVIPYEEPRRWYGTPGVRPGNDLIGPLRRLFRNPQELLDFTPRKEPGYVDPERERFERYLEGGLELPRTEMPPER